jgi:hypothetical protein
MNSGLQAKIDGEFINFINLSDNNIVFSTKETENTPKITIKENKIDWTSLFI